MFTFPICLARVFISNLSDIIKHLIDHKNRGDPHSYPIHCHDCTGAGDFKEPKTFLAHYSRAHLDLVGLENGNQPYVDLPHVDVNQPANEPNILPE